MTGALVRRARYAAQLVLASLVLLGAGRIAWTSFDAWWFGEEPPSASPEAMAAAQSSTAQAAAVQAGAVEPAQPVSELIPIVLSVSHGGERSEVFLDGMPLGHTAYLGDVSCRRGTDITVRIQPKRGPAIERVRRCEGSMISVKEP